MKTTDRIEISDDFLKFLNGIFHLLHVTLILFFLFGWLFDKTLVLHFTVSLLILFSWVVLGAYFGFGYCLVTDLQWRIRRRLRQEPGTKYYMKYLLDKLTRRDTDADLVNRVTTLVFFIILALSAVLVVRRYCGG